MKPVFKIRVQQDQFTEAASKAFDYKFEGESTFEGWEKPAIPDEFSIGLIIGPSGSGKSLLLKQFGAEEAIRWEPEKAIVSHFRTPEDALDRLMAVGLNSIPSWCRPYHVLSNGEKFRADLARQLKNGAVIDEFTSVIDRNVAKAASVALRRYVDRTNLKNIVLASCHYDILDYLKPDWYFDTSDGKLYDGRLLQRPEIEIKIYPCTKDIWPMFAKHHYLTESLNKTSRTYIATALFWSNDPFEIPQETLVGFVSSLPQPSGTLKNAYREHRTVVLPDFQGLGIGPKISDTVAQIHLDEGKRYFSRTAHPRFGAYRDRSPKWRKTSKYKKLRKREEQTSDEHFRKRPFDFERVCFSHEYIGEPR